MKRYAGESIAAAAVVAAAKAVVAAAAEEDDDDQNGPQTAIVTAAKTVVATHNEKTSKDDFEEWVSPSSNHTMRKRRKGAEKQALHFPVLKQIALEHPVVKLPFLLCPLPKRLLKFRMGGEDADPPALRQAADGGAEGVIELRRLIVLQKPLSVGGIGHHSAVGLVGVEAACVGHFKGGTKMDQSIFPKEVASIISGVIIYLCAFMMLFKNRIARLFTRKQKGGII